MREYSRRELLLKGTGAAAGAAVAAYGLRGPARALLPGTARAATTAWNHDPSSPIGPLHWADIDPGFSTCGTGLQQSPVNLEPASAAALHGPPLRLRYHASELAIENTGHVVEVAIPAGVEDVLRIGRDEYALTQYHFHAPSEHTIDGRHADVEAHFVHTNAAGDTAVVGLLFRIGHRPSPLLDTILLRAPRTSGTEGSPLGEANPADLFDHIECAHGRRGHVHVDSFYGYDGSLTTPGCTENVRWSVVAGSGHVSPAAVARFHRVIANFAGYDGYPNDNRPVQPLNGRIVRLRRGREHNH